MRTDLQPILARHPGLLRRMRFVQLRFELRSSDERLRVDVSDERVAATVVPAGVDIPASEFVLQAPEAAWREFSKPLPAPGYNDILALLEAGHARFTGQGLGFYRNLFLVKAIVSAVFRGDARW
ncbi:hypothetical protein [Caenimonas aquaedulcis]|uniref:SCP2 domain-containing protein n=1 Tax=Caenimonas aquaedulcis TaxID=2793270 RepID=A0A931MI10_9BURK|nr:hypothetical protein [Caenimonas aquaedulcis]MBG9389344.1 hypothetical protein [Caenimonas aquaedulcis]